MVDELDDLRVETEAALAAAGDLRAWAAVRVGVLGKSGAADGVVEAIGGGGGGGATEPGGGIERVARCFGWEG